MEHDMPTIFWIATIVMSVLAFSFVAAPLLKNNWRIGTAGIAVALPLFAAATYWFVGSPQAADNMPATATFAQEARHVTPQNNSSVGSVASMVDGLATRLEKNPADGKSWLLLARSYEHLNRMPEARQAYERAAALGEHDDKLAGLFESTDSATSPSAQIFGNLQLSERSREIVLPTDTVFIFARAVDGPPMPIAVLQRPVSDLPLDFLLNDSQSMSADVKLSNFEQVVVTARISRSGVATEALQGLEAKSDAIIVADNRHLNLRIE